MKIGLIISINGAESCWNALRYANFAIGQGDEVKVFLMGKGVEYQKSAWISSILLNRQKS